MSSFWMPDDMEDHTLRNEYPIPQDMLNHVRKMLKLNRIVAIGFDRVNEEWVILGYQFTKGYIGRLENV